MHEAIASGRAKAVRCACGLAHEPQLHRSVTLDNVFDREHVEFYEETGRGLGASIGRQCLWANGGALGALSAETRNWTRGIEL